MKRNSQFWRVAAYVGLAIAGAAGLWRVETSVGNAHQAAKDARHALEVAISEEAARAAALCQQSNVTRSSVRLTFVDIIELAARSSADPDLTPEEREHREAEREVFLEEFEDVLKRRLPKLDCG